ncbi:MAG: DUF424 family protein [Candidatus Micrarchaeota archaeon]|nr:DUF424 family protein [Candidatus Micrarchaeota archaeon]
MEENKNSKIFYKIHEQQGELILALCDGELIGKKFSDSKRVLDLDTFKNFYFGQELNLKEIKILFEQCDSINIVGKEAVALALGLGYIKHEDIIYIDKIPHVQIYKLWTKG